MSMILPIVNQLYIEAGANHGDGAEDSLEYRAGRLIAVLYATLSDAREFVANTLEAHHPLRSAFADGDTVLRRIDAILRDAALRELGSSDGETVRFASSDEQIS